MLEIIGRHNSEEMNMTAMTGTNYKESEIDTERRRGMGLGRGGEGGEEREGEGPLLPCHKVASATTNRWCVFSSNTWFY